jgi:hypothetical protein
MGVTDLRPHSRKLDLRKDSPYARSPRQLRPSVSQIFVNEVVGPFSPMAAPYSRCPRKVRPSVHPIFMNEVIGPSTHMAAPD